MNKVIIAKKLKGVCSVLTVAMATVQVLQKDPLQFSCSKIALKSIQ